jgi:hypothetical protein
MMVFHNNSLSAPRITTNSTFTAVGCSLREDMLWLMDSYSGIPDDPPVDSPWASGYSKAVRLLSCSQERAHSIYFWQCFEKPNVSERYSNFSKRYCQDMLSEYVPEHHNGRTPLQLSAVGLAYCLARGQSEILQNLETMIVCIIESGADLHETKHGYTPFALFIAAIPLNWRYRGDDSGVDGLRARDLRRMLKVWLDILKCAGVDLITYGAEEKRVLEAHRFLENPPIQAQPWDWDGLVFGDEVYYFRFCYGPTPDDWRVQFDMVGEYASDFWRMPGLLDGIEVQAMPGSWIDT